jgi:hypothetical protein
MPLQFSGMRQTSHESRHIHRPHFDPADPP